MTCAVVRQRLLASERPDQPAPEDSRHLAGCPSCHAWLRRLVRLERQLPLVNVPTCPPPPALLAHVLAGTARAVKGGPVQKTGQAPLVRPPLPQHDQRRVREGGRQKLALAFSLAATLALFTFAWWAWPPGPAEPPRDRSAYAKKRDAVIRHARTPHERFNALAGWADGFLAEVRAHGDDPQRVAELAQDFDRLVQDDLIAFARLVPLAERPAVLEPVAARLRITDSDASRLAAAWTERHAAAAKSVLRIAAAARKADERLRELARA